MSHYKNSKCLSRLKVYTLFLWMAKSFGKSLKQDISVCFPFKTSTFKSNCEANDKSYFSAGAGKIHFCL